MLLSDIYRFLESEEQIVPGDQWKPAGLSDDYWAPASAFIGHRPREFNRWYQEKIMFRRLIVHEVQV